jgi:hypothetical protein
MVALIRGTTGPPDAPEKGVKGKLLLILIKVQN